MEGQDNRAARAANINGQGIAANGQPQSEVRAKTTRVLVPGVNGRYRVRIERDIPQIKSLIAQGYGRSEIRRTLGLTEYELNTRLRYIGEDEFGSRAVIWQNFRLAKNAYLSELEELKQSAKNRKQVILATTVTGTGKDRVSKEEPIEVDAPDFRTAVECVKAQNTVYNETVEMARTLGLIPDAPPTGDERAADALLKLAESVKAMNEQERLNYLASLPEAGERQGTLGVN